MASSSAEISASKRFKQIHLCSEAVKMSADAKRRLYSYGQYQLLFLKALRNKLIYFFLF